MNHTTVLVFGDLAGMGRATATVFARQVANVLVSGCLEQEGQIIGQRIAGDGGCIVR